MKRNSSLIYGAMYLPKYLALHPTRL